MKKWLLQTSTIGGLLGLVMTSIQLVQSGATALSVASGIVSAALLLVNDGKFLKGLVPVLLFGFAFSACASVPIPIDTQKQIAVESACVLLDQEQCLSTSLEAVGITQDTCGDRLTGIAKGVETIDLKALADFPRKCEKIIKKLTR